MNPFLDDFACENPCAAKGVAFASPDERRDGFTLVLERYHSRNERRVVVPEGVTRILAEAFRDHDEVVELVLPSTLRFIGKGAFRGCTGLREVLIPECVSEIGDAAFSGCRSLEFASLPSGITELGNSVFSRCSGLSRVCGGEFVYAVGAGCFSGCVSLSALPRLPRLEVVGPEAFAGCSSLESLALPESVRIVGAEAFRNCSHARRAVVPVAAEDLGRNLFSGCGNLHEIEGLAELAGSFPDAFPRRDMNELGLLRPQDYEHDVREYLCAHEGERAALEEEISQVNEEIREQTVYRELLGVMQLSERRRVDMNLVAAKKRLFRLRGELEELLHPSDEALSAALVSARLK